MAIQTQLGDLVLEQPGLAAGMRIVAVAAAIFHEQGAVLLGGCANGGRNVLMALEAERLAIRFERQFLIRRVRFVTDRAALFKGCMPCRSGGESRFDLRMTTEAVIRATGNGQMHIVGFMRRMTGHACPGCKRTVIEFLVRLRMTSLASLGHGFTKQELIGRGVRIVAHGTMAARDHLVLVLLAGEHDVAECAGLVHLADQRKRMPFLFRSMTGRATLCSRRRGMYECSLEHLAVTTSSGTACPRRCRRRPHARNCNSRAGWRLGR